MEPVTHVLTSLALARAGQKHLPKHGMAMLLVAGVAPDLDFASYLGGAGSFLRLNRALLHSLPCSIVLACAIAGAFCFFEPRRDPERDESGPSVGARLGFGTAFTVCSVGIAGHLLLDLASGAGVELLWPLRTHWFAFDLLAEVDPWILILLGAGLLLPMLLRLVGEEIGERKKRVGGQRGAAVTLIVLLAYMAARGYLHSRALDLVESRDYRGRIPLRAGAFPESSLPLEWRGVVSTDNTIEEVPVSLAPSAEFDPERSATEYKPEDSPALETGQRTATAQRFLSYARFPLASVVQLEEGYRFELRDARFPTGDGSAANIVVLVEMRGNLQITSERFQFASSRN